MPGRYRVRWLVLQRSCWVYLMTIFLGWAGLRLATPVCYGRGRHHDRLSNSQRHQNGYQLCKVHESSSAWLSSTSLPICFPFNAVKAQMMRDDGLSAGNQRDRVLNSTWGWRACYSTVSRPQGPMSETFNKQNDTPCHGSSVAIHRDAGDPGVAVMTLMFLSAQQWVDETLRIANKDVIRRSGSNISGRAMLRLKARCAAELCAVVGTTLNLAPIQQGCMKIQRLAAAFIWLFNLFATPACFNGGTNNKEVRFRTLAPRRCSTWALTSVGFKAAGAGSAPRIWRGLSLLSTKAHSAKTHGWAVVSSDHKASPASWSAGIIFDIAVVVARAGEVPVVSWLVVRNADPSSIVIWLAFRAICLSAPYRGAVVFDWIFRWLDRHLHRTRSLAMFCSISIQFSQSFVAEH